MTMKRFLNILPLALAAILAVSCYDDSKVMERLDNLESRVDSLTTQVGAVETLIKALESNVYIKAVTEVTGGYEIEFTDGKKITIKDGENGADAPEIGAVKDTDGVYYWAVYNHGEFAHFLEVDGAYVPVFAEDAELVFDVDEATGNLLVSVDGGKTFVDSGIAAESEACVVSDVVVNENGTVTLVLADGSEVVVAMAELIEFDVRGALYVKAGESKTVSFEAGETVTDVEVMNQPYGWKAVVAENTLTVTAPKTEVVALGAAEKSGLVSLHINTASGACKVAKLQVNFAELSLEVAKDGAITVKNSLVQTFTAMDWETWMQVEKTDFVNWTLGVCFYDDYVRAGSIQNVFNSYDIDYWTINDENFAYSGFEADQFSYNKVPYQEGVVDELVFT